MLWKILTLLMITQIHWEKYQGNPVQPYGAQPAVLKDGDTMRMWYSVGAADSLGLMVVIFYATSVDGISWADIPEGTIFPGEPGSWDSRVRDTPWVLKDDEGYKLWYTGATAVGSQTMDIGFATSENGINWDFYPEPVLRRGEGEAWDALWVESPCVIYDDGIYRMWYTGFSRDWRGSIGYAESQDGINWEKHDGPVLVGEEWWEDFVVGVPAVIKRDTLFEMWYGAISIEDMADDTVDTVSIGYATSRDGMNWVKYNENPVLTTYYPTYDPDSGGPWAPSVLFFNEQFWMWYESITGIGLATAPLEAVSEKSRSLSLLTISPNPTVGILYFKGIDPSDPISIRLFDLQGRFIWGDRLRERVVRLQVPPGIYFLLVGNGRSLKKIKVSVVR